MRPLFLWVYCIIDVFLFYLGRKDVLIPYYIYIYIRKRGVFFCVIFFYPKKYVLTSFFSKINV